MSRLWEPTTPGLAREVFDAVDNVMAHYEGVDVEPDEAERVLLVGLRTTFSALRDHMSTEAVMALVGARWQEWVRAGRQEHTGGGA